MFKYEMHLHTLRCSACAVSSATEQVEQLYKAGYAGAVFTNHFYRGNTAIDRNLDWRDFVGEYAEDFLEAKAVGESLGLDIFFGLEEGYSRGKEVLIYGLSPEDFLSCPDFIGMDLEEISGFVRQKGGFIACAHPFRQASYIPDPDNPPPVHLIDGVEVYNAGNADEWNEKAMKFALSHDLVQISGGDVHNINRIGIGGIATEKRIQSSSELVSVLKSRTHRIIINGNII